MCGIVLKYYLIKITDNIFARRTNPYEFEFSALIRWQYLLSLLPIYVYK